MFDRDGLFVARPDLSYVRERIAVEYEGGHHQSDPATYLADIERRARLVAAGWFVILVVKEHLRERPEWVAQQIRAALRERANLGPAE